MLFKFVKLPILVELKKTATQTAKIKTTIIITVTPQIYTEAANFLFYRPT